MNTKKEKGEEWAGDILARLKMYDDKNPEHPFNERLVLYCLIEITATMKEMKDRIEKIEFDLNYHVYMADDFKD